MKLVMSQFKDFTILIQKNYLFFCSPGHNSISPLSSLNNFLSVWYVVSSTADFPKYTDAQLKTVNLYFGKISKDNCFVKEILNADWEGQKISVNDPKACFISIEVLTF